MAVAGLERFKPNTDRPADFLKFWALTVAELQEVEPAPAADALEAAGPDLQLRRVCYTSLGGAIIHGYLLRPGTVQSRPLIVHAHGYNDRYEVMLEWARRGFNVFGFDARGFGRSARAASLAEDGYVLTGIESPEKSILRGAVADFLQAQRVARELLEERVTSVNFAGFSYGGALALMAAALSREPGFVAVGQPTFGWNSERRRLALGGSTQQVNDYIARFPWRLDSVMRTLEFFDTMHFAPLIRASVLVGIGLDDDVVPSRTVLAIVNHLTSPVEVRLLPVSHSLDPREQLWQEFRDEWLGYVAHGLPPDFGQTGRQVRTLVA